MHIYHWGTFACFLLVGGAQTIIAWDSGYLAVKGIEDRLGTASRRHYRAFIFLGIFLLLMTAAAGYLNDHVQHDADTQADEQGTRANKLQRTVNSQTGLLTNQSLLLARANSAIDELKQGNAPFRGQFDKLQREMAEMQATVIGYTHVPVDIQTPAVPVGPYTALTDDQLRLAVTSFQTEAQAKYRTYWDLQDEKGRLLRLLQGDRTSRADVENTAQSFATKDLQIEQMTEAIIGEDIPRANEYIAEVNRRMHTTIRPIKTSPSAQAANDFLIRIRYFKEDLLKQDGK